MLKKIFYYDNLLITNNNDFRGNPVRTLITDHHLFIPRTHGLVTFVDNVSHNQVYLKEFELSSNLMFWSSLKTFSSTYSQDTAFVNISESLERIL